ncbi:MAG: FapA family protein [Planctomycetota bacterium]
MPAQTIQLRVKVDAERQSATVEAAKGVDPAALSAGAIESSLIGEGVEITPRVRATLKQLADAVAKRVAAGEPAGGFQAVVARAQPVRPGKDGRVEWFAKALPGDFDLNSPELQNFLCAAPGDDAVDFYAQSKYVTVEAGQVVGRVYPAVEGEDGRDVLGRVIAVKPPVAAKAGIDETMVVDAAGRIVAQTQGVLSHGASQATISKRIEVDHFVDFSTGNICFSGDVHIRQGVRDKFRVEAEGDVEIDGLIEAAEVVAGGSLNARGGFAGREVGRAVTGGDLHARYLDQVEAEVGGDLRVDREVVNCRVAVFGGVDCPTGALVGGRLTATGRVEIGTLGSAGAAPTELAIGAVPRLEAAYLPMQAILDELDAEHESLMTERKRLADLGRYGPLSAPNRERDTEVSFALAENRRLAERARPVAWSLSAQIERERTYDLEVIRRVHEGVRLVTPRQTYVFRDEVSGPLRVSANDQGELLYRKGSGGDARPLTEVTDSAAGSLSAVA